MNLTEKRILVTGGYGFLGKHICNQLIQQNINEINTLNSNKKGFYRFSSKNCDLTNPFKCEELLNVFKPEIVIHAAARVGGIGANMKFPADYYYQNCMMGTNIIHSSKNNNIEKLVIIGTICSYPKFTPIPFNEENLWNGYPEETNAAYGIAKKSLYVQATAYKQQYNLNFIYLLPVNLYGVGDNFSENTSHVIPALIKKIIYAKKHNHECVEVWGTGEATREFLYVEDAADAIIKATQQYNLPEPMNLGYGTEISIRNLAILIAKIIDFKGELVFNKLQPDGQPRRCLDVSKSNKHLGFYAKTDLIHGLEQTIKWYENSTG